MKPDNTYIDGIVCDAALEALRTRTAETQPFFLAVGFRKPHLPFCAPKRYWDLYDLREDPNEFRNLADDPVHSDTLQRLQNELARWRSSTADPLLRAENVLRLQQEIEACFRDGTPDKDALSLTYPDYFFAR